ncbi:MAG: hypothetical protein AAF843_04055 [Bacteroidota bacterium]
MKLCLYVTLAKSYLDVLPHQESISHDITYFDLDNFSDDLVISTVIKALSKFDSIHLVIKAVEGVKLGGVLKMFNALISYDGALSVSVEGKHKVIENMIKRLPVSQ